MNRDEIADAVHESTGDLTSKVAARRVVKEVFEQIAKALESDDVVLHGFGRFLRKDRAARNGKNPQTGEPLVIAARTIVQFKPTGSLKQRVNN